MVESKFNDTQSISSTVHLWNVQKKYLNILTLYNSCFTLIIVTKSVDQVVICKIKIEKKMYWNII